MPRSATAAEAQAADEQSQYLTFMLGGEQFAIGILGIKEIIEYAGLTEVPMMPECIRGVINMRGAVVPVLDLSARFGRKVTAITKRTCIIIVEIESDGERHDMGVIVDAVNAVLEIPLSEIEPAPAFGAKIRTDFIAGMGKVNGKFVILLNVDQVLSPDEISALAQVGANAQASAGVPGPT
ncbi:MAG: chemotaxis protein CheW [Mizugakiibacter sp.]|uniref:chemotaxis protein CheW n=1 Tax=Mizugakiibacter sp. TaxID=1972610 RepID=UPI0032100A15